MEIKTEEEEERLWTQKSTENLTRLDLSLTK